MYMRLSIAALLIGFLSVLAEPAAFALPNEPTGFGDVRFRMSVGAVKQIFPQVKKIEVPAETPGPGATPARPQLDLAVYSLENQSIYGLKPCTVGFQFAGDALYQITFDCGHSKRVFAVLKKRFGTPAVTAYGTFWYGDKTVVSINRHSMTFGFADRQLNEAVQRQLYAYVLLHQGATVETGTPPAAATPPTPVPVESETTPGKGWFTQRRIPSGGRTPFGVVVSDFNGDQRPDLAVTNAASDTIAILLGAPDGSFAPPIQWPAHTASRGLEAADFNGDGHSDLVAANISWNSAVVLLADGKGGATWKAYYAGVAPFNVAVADLDNDAKLDVVVASESNISSLKGRGNVGLLFGDGHGDFPRTTMLEAGTNPADVKVADFNADGIKDIAVVNWGSQDISLFQGQGKGKFSAARSIPYQGPPAYSLAVGDLNGDGSPDIVVGDVSGVVHVLYNDGKGNFTASTPLVAGEGLRTVIMADLNGDGLLDLATANSAAGTVTVFLATKGGGFAPRHNVAVGTEPRVVTAADLNGDGKPDLVVTNGGSHDLSILINNGFDAH